MEAIWAVNKNNSTLWLEMGEIAGWEGLRAILVGHFFRHAIAIVFNLLFLVSVILKLCWTRCKFCTPRPPTPPVPFDGFASKFKVGIVRKLALCGCIFLSICYSILGIWNPVYWRRGLKVLQMRESILSRIRLGLQCQLMFITPSQKKVKRSSHFYNSCGGAYHSFCVLSSSSLTFNG